MSSMSYIPLVSEQPNAATMVPCATEKSAHCCQDHQSCANDSLQRRHHGKCHSSGLRRFILPSALALLVLLTGLFALSYPSLGLDELLPRAITSGTNNNGSPFVNKKLYLIILFIGIVVVIGLGIALSFWCCKGAFKNPLCCPCYLCACCGGLACLECIGCGFCAEAMEQA